MRVRDRVAVLAVACLAACTASEPPSKACHNVSFDPSRWQLTPGGLPIMPCAEHTDCPPPLECGFVELPEDAEEMDEADAYPTPNLGERIPVGVEACVLNRDGTPPELMVEAFGRPSLPVELIDQSGGDGVVIRWQAPEDARTVRCTIFGCAMTVEHLSQGLDRCVVHDVQRDAVLGDSITITPRAQTSPAELNPTTVIRTCGNEVEVTYTATEFSLMCWAFSETDLVAVSSVLRLKPDQLGRYRDLYLAQDCRCEDADRIGAACLLEPEEPTSEMGVCRESQCCATCWTDEQCQGYTPGRCRVVPRQPDMHGSTTAGPFTGYCEGSCVARQDARDAECARQPAEGQPSGETLDGGDGETGGDDDMSGGGDGMSGGDGDAPDGGDDMPDGGGGMSGGGDGMPGDDDESEDGMPGDGTDEPRGSMP